VVGRDFDLNTRIGGCAVVLIILSMLASKQGSAGAAGGKVRSETANIGKLSLVVSGPQIVGG
jgi:hypothetical protein